MTIFGLYDSPDSVMETVQKYPHQRLATCSPDRLLHSPNLHRLHLCRDSISPEGRGGRIVYQPVVLDSFFRLRASTGGQKCIDLCMMTGFRSFVIVYTNRLHSYYTPITVVFPMSRCHPRTLHGSGRRDIGFWSSCHFQSISGMKPVIEINWKLA